jgi:hypothetical protein
MAVLLLPDSTIHMTLFGQKFTPQIVTVAAYQGIIEIKYGQFHGIFLL